MRKLNKYRQATSPEHYLSQRSKLLDSGCIEFTGARDRDGYGQCHYTKYGKILGVTRAHQMSFVVNFGKIPDNCVVCHTCDNPSCINPDHLFAGTILDNNLDKINKGRANTARGIRNSQSKLTEKQVIEIKNFKGRKTSLEVAKMYGISFSNVCLIWRGQSWGHL